MSVLRNVNFIIDIAKIQCAEPDTWLMIRTALPSAPLALLQLFVPGCSEILQARIGVDPFGGAFEPIVKGGKFIEPPAKRGRHGKAIGAGIAAIGKGQEQGGRAFLFKIGFFHLQRALWWWQVAEVTTEFVATWQSVIYEEQGCALPNTGHVAAALPLFGFPEGTFLWVLPSRAKPPCIDMTTLWIQFNEGCSGTIMWTAQWEGYPNPDGPLGSISTYLREVETGEVFSLATTNEEGQGNGNVTGGFHRHRGQNLPRATRYQLIVESHPAQTAIKATSGQIMIDSSGFPHSSAFGCIPKVAQPPGL